MHPKQILPFPSIRVIRFDWPIVVMPVGCRRPHLEPEPGADPEPASEANLDKRSVLAHSDEQRKHGTTSCPSLK